MDLGVAHVGLPKQWRSCQHLACSYSAGQEIYMLFQYSLTVLNGKPFYGF